MIMEAIRRSIVGVAFAGIITFIALTTLVITDTEAPVTQIWLYMLCSIIIGIYFALSSFIYGDNGWSNLKQTVVHFLLSITFYLIIALSVGWISWKISDILLCSLIFILIYAVFWTAYYMYYKKIEVSMNENLKKKQARK
ncbi:Protein of unknown function [Gracilibacillus ureilyticus]|uniref:DUF3021 domain-containing protein n=1 Tax=Gracilibacillus ureilyticus TaxID=531814 RepID=A0A1H9NBB0_9BACI|nr:DUF3021 domain-containing protein [Gracilibacillus ureilyticus]SER33234.1 Protein of unknown function [Gracilibacillus ureilyticus]